MIRIVFGVLFMIVGLCVPFLYAQESLLSTYREQMVMIDQAIQSSKDEISRVSADQRQILDRATAYPLRYSHSTELAVDAQLAANNARRKEQSARIDDLRLKRIELKMKVLDKNGGVLPEWWVKGWRPEETRRD